ncbi:MAG: hypothetical protein QOJ90_1051 [Actinomycetota bacterium]|jgi:hypothetical protein|nr:hypothetical protein [Actinomycetota bacterium]MDQ1641700.1 hypothetical protein [Actinomycetota bacterium]
MGSKNKGGREVRKPKQEKKPKASATSSIVPPTGRPPGK